MDMLVRLYDLPDITPVMKKMDEQGIKIERAFPPNRLHIIDWVKKHSGIYGAGEAECCFGKKAPTLFIASRDNKILGYACYNATAPDYFGPTRVLDEEQGKGIGKALLLKCMYALREEGYGYAIIGYVGPVEFYEKCLGAVKIENSSPGLYHKMLRIKNED